MQLYQVPGRISGKTSNSPNDSHGLALFLIGFHICFAFTLTVGAFLGKSSLFILIEIFITYKYPQSLILTFRWHCALPYIVVIFVQTYKWHLLFWVPTYLFLYLTRLVFVARKSIQRGPRGKYISQRLKKKKMEMPVSFRPLLFLDNTTFPSHPSCPLGFAIHVAMGARNSRCSLLPEAQPKFILLSAC